MKTFLLVLLVVAVAIAAFFLGQRNAAPAASPATTAAPAPAAVAAPASEEDHSKLPSSQPVRTFRGPDGLPHIIVYDPANIPDNNDPEQVRAALLEDMRNHPGNIVQAYDLTEAQIADIVSGKQALPENLLPKPGAPATR